MRRAAHQDGNHRQIVEALEAVGCIVLNLAPVGKGCPDLLVGYRGDNFLLEIKDGSLPESRRQLTADQLLWHERWRGQLEVVTTIDEALEAVGAIDGGWR